MKKVHHYNREGNYPSGNTSELLRSWLLKHNMTLSHSDIATCYTEWVGDLAIGKTIKKKQQKTN